MAIHITFFLLISCLFFQTACTSATSPVKSAIPTRGDYTFMHKEISNLIKKKMKKNDVTGLSIAVVDGQKIVWKDGFGWADKKNKIKATPETVYRVGSITKLFTVTSAMQLAEQGKVDIDQPLQKVLPQFEIKSRFKNADSITLRNIMTHHSGIPANYARGMWSEEPESFTRLVDLLKDEYTAYPPNTIFSYSNVAMTLLGHAVQEVSDQPYGELIEQKLLIPMGMSDSYIANALRNETKSSKGYSDNAEAIAMPLRDIPAGGLNSTVLDLANFTKMVFAGGRSGGQQIVKAETLDEMMQFQDGDAPFDLGKQMGLGWFLEKQDSTGSGLKASHGGDTFLFHSMLTTYPRYKLAVIVLSNSESAAGIVSEIADEALTLALATKTGIRRPDTKHLSDVELPATSEDLKTFPGYYSSENGVIQIKNDGDRLQLISDDDTLNLILRQDGKYHLQYKLLGLFTIDLEGLDELGISYGVKNGREVLLGEYRGYKMFVGEKIIPTPITESWKSRTGSYEIINPTPATFYKDLELGIENDFLVVRYAVQQPYKEDVEEGGQFVLKIVDDLNAVIHGLGSGLNETIRVVHQDGDELLLWSGFLLRKVR
jgi:CubicO group peptidase (beta-lactamase class C family)